MPTAKAKIDRVREIRELAILIMADHPEEMRAEEIVAKTRELERMLVRTGRPMKALKFSKIFPPGTA